MCVWGVGVEKDGVAEVGGQLGGKNTMAERAIVVKVVDAVVHTESLALVV